MAGCADRKLLLALLIMLLISSGWALQGREHRPKSRPNFLQLFSHESRVPPTNTLIVSVAPSGSTTGADEFGLIRSVSNVLREGPSYESAIIGSQVGIVVVGKESDNIFISCTYFLNENSPHRGTIAVHGHIDGTSTVDRVFAVVGGTGDFLSVTGDDRSASDQEQAASQPGDILNVHNLTLHYPQW